MTSPRAEAAESKYRIVDNFDYFTLERWRIISYDFSGDYYKFPRELWGWYSVNRKFNSPEEAKRYAKFLKSGPTTVEEFTLTEETPNE